MRSVTKEYLVAGLFLLVNPAQAVFIQMIIPEEPGPKKRRSNKMALTRKFLRTMGIEDDKVDQIIEAHTETVDGLRDALEKAQAEAEKLPELQKQLETAQADLDAVKKDSYKVKYEAIKEDFDAYKAEQANKETHAAKETAFRALLKEAGVSERRIDAVLRVSDVDGVELDDKGKITDAKDRMKAIKAEWSDFIETREIRGAETPDPPANTGAHTMTVKEIDEIADTEARQKAMLAHSELFGI